MKLYQAVTYTTDHCDADLIEPSFWEPHSDRTKCASEIIAEVQSDLSYLGIKGNMLDHITVEYRNSTDDNIDWSKPRDIKSPSKSKKFLDKLASDLADCKVSTVLVTYPRYLNQCGVEVGGYSNCYHIQELNIKGK